ncbi:MAG: hypothetical protein ACUVTN_11545 [Thermodesulfobacteriota bacterium]
MAIITFLSDNIFEGYGLTLGIGVPLIINGSYEIDIKRKINGNLTVKDWEREDILGSGNFTGRINKEKTKLSLKILDIPIILNGIRLLEEPEIPENWSVKITGGVKGTILPLNIKPMESEEGGEIYWRIVGFSENGSSIMSNIHSLSISPPIAVRDWSISSTKRSETPILSWRNYFHKKVRV